MKPFAMLALLAVLPTASAQQVGCDSASEGGPWSVLVTEIAAVEVATPSKQSASSVPALNQGDPKLVVVTFPSCQDCQTARNVALTSISFTLPLGTSSAAQAHVGRTVTACFRGK